VVFASLSINDYSVFAVNTTFTQAEPSDVANAISKSSRFFGLAASYQSTDKELAYQLYKEAVAGKLETLDNAACVQAYSQHYLTKRGNLLFVLTNESYPYTPFMHYVMRVNVLQSEQTSCVPESYKWICGELECSETCEARLPGILACASQWQPQLELSYPPHVDHYLSQPTKERCKLQFSLHIIMLVICFNTVKVILMIWLAFGMDESLLLITGDGVASFLIKPDAMTTGRCLLSMTDVQSAAINAWSSTGTRSSLVVAKQWKPVPVRWSQAVSWARWLLSCSL
jgi:hypothetical protein